jgi:predicted Zn-ribbon and HTH transcriptional regulator
VKQLMILECLDCGLVEEIPPHTILPSRCPECGSREIDMELEDADEAEKVLKFRDDRAQ